MHTLSAQSNYSQPYTFRTLAGYAGYGSRDGLGSEARFWGPFGVAVDAAQNLYVADTYNHTIRKITPAGAVTTVAGLAGWSGSADGVGSNARFNSPRGVAVDSLGSLYVADSGNAIIRKITPDGAVSTLAGLPGSPGTADGMGSEARFHQPSGVAVDGAGNLYVADGVGCTIRKLTPGGAVTTLAGLGGTSGTADGVGSSARFVSPRSVAVDRAGNLYVADSGGSTIRKVTPDGVVSTLAGVAGSVGSADGTGSTARFRGPWGVGVDAAGNVYVADNNNNTIRKITPEGAVSTLAGLAGPPGSVDGTGSAARFYYPAGMAVDSTGNVYVGDGGNNTLRKITPAAVVSTVAGLAGGPGSLDGSSTVARFGNTTGLTVDGWGNTYVADHDNNTIRKITPGGVVSTLAGLAGASGSTDGLGSLARFSTPHGVVSDRAGTLYVVEQYNHTVRKVTPAGEVSTLAGLAGASGSADGVGSEARFKYPAGIALDSAGNLYVADSVNNTIRKVTPAGEVSTLAGLAGASGSADGAGINARFNYPQGIAVDRAANVYVADSYNHTIRKLTPDGMVSTLAGLAGARGSADGVGGSARFYEPSGIAVDSVGNLYVADTANYTIRRITPDGVVSTVAGLVAMNGCADGTGANGRFYRPVGIAVDDMGTLYVSDTSNHTIHQGWPAPPPPLLSATRVGETLLLSWPLTASNFLLEARSALSPAAAWAPVTNPVGISGSCFILTNGLEGQARCFRLRLP